MKFIRTGNARKRGVILARGVEFAEKRFYARRTMTDLGLKGDAIRFYYSKRMERSTTLNPNFSTFERNKVKLFGFELPIRATRNEIIDEGKEKEK